MSILFHSGGILTTVQDLGRVGFRHLGINPNGAMDMTAARLINILLGNCESEGVLEIHFPAPKILFTENTIIALGGADFGARVDEQEVENWRPIFVEKGGVLDFPQKVSVNRIYLGVQGGFKIENWLGSASTNLKAKAGGFQGRSLRQGDQLLFKKKLNRASQNLRVKVSKSLIPPYSSLPTVRALPSAEFENLTVESRKIFQTQNFSLRPESDRMGFRLQGKNLKLKKPLEMISSAVNFGTIQLLPDGQLIVLMADHQTTGGYPRIANVISRDLPLVGQLGANDGLNFKIISSRDAENLMLALEKDLHLLKTACRFLC